MRWIEGNLLDFGEVVDGILVEGELADLLSRVLGLRPNMGEIKDVNLVLLPSILGLFSRHSLNLNCPLRKFASLNGLVEIFLRMVGRLGSRILLCDEFCALHGFHVDLNVLPIAILVDEFDSVAQPAVHESITIWDASVTK